MVDRIPCPLCERAQPVPKTEGYRCLSCGVTGEVHTSPEGEPAVTLRGLRAKEACPADCGGKVSFQDAFCQACGEAVSEELRETLKLAERKEQEALTRGRMGHLRAATDRKRKMARAAVWLLVMAVLFFLVGTAMGLMAGSNVEEVIQGMGDMPDDAILPLPGGEEITFAEAKAQMRAEPVIIFIVYYVLAAIMLALFFWAKRSPLPAIITAICVYAVVVVAGAVTDPTSLFKGLLFKIVFIVLMVGGLRAALAQRAAEMREQARAARGS